MNATATATPGVAYRPEIDGLRGLAVLGVILFHADPSWVPGGYAGVDIFFVISGYLIARIVSGELQAGSYRAARFFERRIRRLLPVLLLVLACCLVPAWLWLLPRQLETFAGSVMAVNVLLANIYFWRQTGYFSAGAEEHPLLHTWSLSVEEQFYLLFALAFPWCWRHARRRLAAVLLLTSMLSLLACDIASRVAPAFAFYTLPFRAWELLAGVLLGLAAAERAPWLMTLQRHNRTVGWAGLLMIGLAFFGLNAETPFPSAYALLPVTGTALLLAQQDRAEGLARVLRWRPLVAIGLLSYGAYLWHQPVFVFARLAWPEPLSGLAMALFLVPLTFALSAVSWRLVEQPLRDRQRTSTLRLGVLLLAGLLLVNGTAWWLTQQRGAPERLTARALDLLAYAEDKNPRQMACLAQPTQPMAPAESCVIGRKGVTPTVAVLGDSHADSLFVALDKRLAEAGLSARFLAQAGCPPVPGLLRADTGARSDCDRHQRELRSFLSAHPEIDTLLVASRWAAYLEGGAFDNGAGGRTGGPDLRTVPASDWHWWWRSAPNDHRDAVAKLVTTGLQSLLQGTRRLVLVYPIPEVGWSVPEHQARLAWRGQQPVELSTGRTAYDLRNQAVIARLDAVQGANPADPHLLRIRPADLFCGDPPSDRCMATQQGLPLYYDDNHLNGLGADLLVQRISTALGWATRRGD